MLRNVINLLVTAEDQRELFRAAQLRKQKNNVKVSVRHYSQIKYILYTNLDMTWTKLDIS